MQATTSSVGQLQALVYETREKVQLCEERQRILDDKVNGIQDVVTKTYEVVNRWDMDRKNQEKNQTSLAWRVVTFVGWGIVLPGLVGGLVGRVVSVIPPAWNFVKESLIESQKESQLYCQQNPSKCIDMKDYSAT